MRKIMSLIMIVWFLVVGGLVYATAEVVTANAKISLMEQSDMVQYPKIPGAIFNAPEYPSPPML